MKIRTKIIVVFISLITIAACKKKENNLSKIPAIKFVFVTPEVKAGSSRDTVFIDFTFADGDANIQTDGTSENIFISNTRDSLKFDQAMPNIPDAYKDPAIGFQGLCRVRIEASFLQITDTAATKDSLQFKIKLRDEAGNFSNEIITPVVYLLKP